MSINSYPVHNSLQLTTTGSSYTSFYVPYESAFMGYVDMALGTTGSSYSTFKVAGYQYLLGYITHIFDDYVNTLDSLNTDVTQTFDDYVNTTDFVNNGYSIFTDLVPVLDELKTDVVLTLEDYINVNDDLVSVTQLNDFVNILDELNVSIVKTFTEYTNCLDTADAFLYFDDYDSTIVGIMQPFQYEDTAIIRVSSTFEQEDTTNVGVRMYSLPDTTNASSVNNPFYPTIIMDGQVVTYNPLTAPSSYNSSTRDVWINNIAIGNFNYCNIYDYNINLDEAGGTWDIFADVPIGPLLGQVTICGLSGTTTRIKQEWSNSTYGYRSSGIFGNPVMSRPLNMIGDSLLFQLLTNPRTGIKPAEFFTTYAGAAQSIARLAGSGLNWYIADFPYIETFSQEGASIMDALNSVVSTVGGKLRWDGTNNYMAIYPPFTTGSFSIPSWKLVTAANGEQIGDISTGTAGVGSFGFQVYTNNIALGLGLPTDTVPDNQYNIQPVYTTSKAMSSEDPDIPIKVAADAVELYVQILVKEGFAGTAAYLTNNENEWFSLGSPALTNPYFKPNYTLGQQYSLIAYCNQGLFPANSEPIDNGNFVLRLGVRRYDPRAEFLAAKDLRDAQVKNQIARTVGQMRYIKSYVANFACQFFGALPIPGMRLEDVYICGTNKIEGGVVESVSLTSPGVLTIQAVQYSKIDFHANLAGATPQNPTG